MISHIKNLLKSLAQLIFGDYGIYIIYKYKLSVEKTNFLIDLGELTSLTREDIKESSHALIREQVWYVNDQSYAYGFKKNNEIVSICFFWTGQHYRKQRNFWLLEVNEAKLVQIITLPEMRGQGLAKKLIRFACQQMYQKEFHVLYARVWHSNYASKKAFESSGWGREALVIEVFPFKGKKSYKFIYKY